MLIVTIGTLFTTIGSAQDLDKKAITKTIETFSKAADRNDAVKLETVLDHNYRIIMNRLFGSTDVIVMNKATYLEKIKSKEYGGDKRELSIQDIMINGNTANAKVEFKGTKMTFCSILTFIKDSKNNWKLIQDVPIIK